METIFLVTVFQKIAKSNYDKNLPDFGDRRCVGWFNNKNEAIFSLENNIGNIHTDERNVYEYAIIEEVEPGIMQVDINSILYKWNNNIYGYKEIDKDPLVKTHCNFGIG